MNLEHHSSEDTSASPFVITSISLTFRNVRYRASVPKKFLIERSDKHRTIVAGEVRRGRRPLRTSPTVGVWRRAAPAPTPPPRSISFIAGHQGKDLMNWVLSVNL